MDEELAAMAREILDSVAYMALGTTDVDGRPRVSPVYFTPHRYADLYWLSFAEAHHSRNVARDERVSAVVFDSTVPIGGGRAVYAIGRAREVPQAELAERAPAAHRETFGVRAYPPEELSGDDLRLYVLHVDTWEVHIPGGHPTLGTGRDRRVPVDPRPSS